jgi:hypothetical protein
MGGFFKEAVQKAGWTSICPVSSLAQLGFEEGVAVLPETRSIVVKDDDRIWSSQRRALPVSKPGVSDRVFGVCLMTLLLSKSSAVVTGAPVLFTRDATHAGMAGDI